MYSLTLCLQEHFGQSSPNAPLSYSIHFTLSVAFSLQVEQSDFTHHRAGALYCGITYVWGTAFLCCEELLSALWSI